MKLFVYGKEFCRCATTIKMEIDSSYIEEAIVLGLSNNDDAKEDYLESERILNLNYSLRLMLGTIVLNNYAKNQTQQIDKAYREKGEFHLIDEEATYGIASTKKNAKLQFVEADDNGEW